MCPPLSIPASLTEPSFIQAPWGITGDKHPRGKELPVSKRGEKIFPCHHHHHHHHQYLLSTYCVPSPALKAGLYNYPVVMPAVQMRKLKHKKFKSLVPNDVVNGRARI